MPRRACTKPRRPRPQRTRRCFYAYIRARNRDAELVRAYATVDQTECTAAVARATIEEIEAASAPTARSAA
jgi:hypothetical protein